MSEKLYLNGNFALAEDEVTCFDPPCRGEIRESLTGRFLRTGSNSIAPEPARRHWFMGNDLVHGWKLALLTQRSRQLTAAG